MADWQRTLNLIPEWKYTQAGALTPHEMAQIIATRLRKLEPFTDDLSHLNDELERIADNFDFFAEDPGTDADDFDGVMNDLYDWADTHIEGFYPHNAKKCCWVKTF